MFRTYFLITLCLAAYCSTAQIKVSDNHRFLTTQDGKPFFWLGDTDWELFHRLTREEAEEFLEIRKQQGFNVIHAVALAEFEGLRKPNRYNDLPLIERLIMRFYFMLKKVSLSEEKGFGLDSSYVTVEKYPLVVAPVSNLNLVRKEN